MLSSGFLLNSATPDLCLGCDSFFFLFLPPLQLVGLEQSLIAEQFDIMEKLKWTLDKLTVHNEPGLTNAQLMLTNDDLRPGKINRMRHPVLFAS